MEVVISHNLVFIYIEQFMKNQVAHKILSFEYILAKLIEWYSCMKPSEKADLSSFTRLKVLKLLFFVAAIKQDNGSDLLDIFDNFYAMQHGPVESDIYNSIINELKYFSFKDRDLYINSSINEDSFAGLTEEEKKTITNSISALRAANNEIILYSASQLVNLSHRWESWKTAIAIADILGKGSEKMSIKLIRESEQYFSI